MRTTCLAMAGVGTIVLLSLGLAANAAEIKVIAAAPMTSVFKELGPQFERDTGHKLVTKFASTPAVKREIDAGEAFDVVISITSGIDDWIKGGKIAAATRVPVAYAGVGIGVRAGAPKPDISSVEAFKLTLLNARSVGHSAEGASAANFKALLDRLGMAEEMKPKLKPMTGGTLLSSAATGEVDLVVVSVPTIAAAPGVELVGSIPAELQTYIRFTAGVSTGAKEPEAAQTLIRFLTSPAVTVVIRAKGMEPGTP